MRIFIISRGYPSRKYPQWGCFEKDQAEALAALGNEVVMLCVETRFRLLWVKPGIHQKSANGVHIFNYYLTPSRPIEIINKKLSQRLIYWQFDKVYRAAVNQFGKPDILYSHYLFVTHNALYLKEKYNIPLVGIEHWSELNKDTLLRDIEKLGNTTYKHLDKVISVSESLRRRLMQHFCIDSTVIHNMISRDFFYKEKERNGNVVQYVAVGSLIYGKGYDILIDAMQKALPYIDSWHLNIIGSGKEKSNLQMQINEARLNKNITLLGKRNKVEIANTLRESDVFILPSRGENFSVAVLEALACGLPVIASICGGIRECINERNGLLFPVDDVESLSKAIVYMQENYKNYNRQEIAKDCQSRFSPQVIAQQLTDVFEEVIHSNKNSTNNTDANSDN